MTRKPLGLKGIDRKLFADLLHELFPLGLTDDCPARKAKP